MIKLLAIDMDGTCLNSRSRITPAVLQALTAAHDAGIQIVPTTGRALCCLPHQLVAHPELYRYAITSNGARVTDLTYHRTIFRAEIPRTMALELMDQLKTAHIGRTAHIDHQYLVEGNPLHAMGRMVYGKDANTSRCIPDLAQEMNSLDLDVEELQFFFLGRNGRQAVTSVLARFPDLCGAYSGLYVEIFHASASKGSGLGALVSHLGLEQEEVACIGDGENDHPMFQVAGLRFAMGNAVDSLKAAADVVLPSNRADGVAMAIQSHILPQNARSVR